MNLRSFIEKSAARWAGSPSVLSYYERNKAAAEIRQATNRAHFAYRKGIPHTSRYHPPRR